MRGVYPTQTYPLHASLVTGCYPHRHGIHANTRFQPGRIHPDWHWYAGYLRMPALFQLATRAGLRVATLLWPGAARSGNRYVIPEIKVTRPGQSLPWLLASGGSPLFMLLTGLRYASLLKDLSYQNLDNFTTAAAARLVRRAKVDLLLLHLLDLDGTRHRLGFHASEVPKVLEQHDRRIGTLLDATARCGLFRQTSFFVFGDHAYFDVHTRIRINAAFRAAGLVEADARGRLRCWKAWANCCGGSAHVRLLDPSDRDVHARLDEVFRGLSEQGRSVMEMVYDNRHPETIRVGGRIDYILEAKTGCYFVPDIEGEVIAPREPHFRATHGYHPDRTGYGSLFLASGRGVRPGIELRDMRITDIGPTAASLLGLEMPGVDGRVRTEIVPPPRRSVEAPLAGRPDGLIQR